MSRRIDIMGHKFGRLTVIGEADPRPDDAYRLRRVLARCDCGQTLPVLVTSLRTGNTMSCGCLHREKTAAINASHGGTTGHRLAKWYTTWSRMLQRCENPNNKNWPEYGGRGIKVCDRWHDPSSFHADMGDPPSPGHSIDRIDNGGDYCPENCRWATRKEQTYNTRQNVIVQYAGRSMCLAEACEAAGVPYHRAYDRINKLGWPVERALGRP
jgi:hypothetical protein